MGILKLIKILVFKNFLAHSTTMAELIGKERRCVI